mgnify:FL=1
MNIFVWAKFPISRSNDKIIPGSLVGIREVGYNFELGGPRLEVVAITSFLQVKGAHGITKLDISKGDPNVLLPSQGYDTINHSIRVDGKLHRVQPIEVENLAKEGIEWMPESTFSKGYNR